MPVALRDLGRAVKQLQYRHHRGMDAELRAAGTSLAQWDALRAIAVIPGASAHLLAGTTFQSDQSFGALATRLERRGLIERRPGSGRAIRHRLTPKGEAALKRGDAVIDRVFEASFAPLGPRQRDELYRLIARVLVEGNPPQKVGLPRPS